jgi:hypothetical protein
MEKARAAAKSSPAKSSPAKLGPPSRTMTRSVSAGSVGAGPAEVGDTAAAGAAGADTSGGTPAAEKHDAESWGDFYGRRSDEDVASRPPVYLARGPPAGTSSREDERDAAAAEVARLRAELEAAQAGGIQAPAATGRGQPPAAVERTSSREDASPPAEARGSGEPEAAVAVPVVGFDTTGDGKVNALDTTGDG